MIQRGAQHYNAWNKGDTMATPKRRRNEISPDERVLYDVHEFLTRREWRLAQKIQEMEEERHAMKRLAESLPVLR